MRALRDVQPTLAFGLCLVLAASLTTLARADVPAQERTAPERIILLQPDTATPRPGLEPSLRIQLRELELMTVRVAFPPDIPSRLQMASDIARERSADWVVWTDDFQTEADASSSQAVLYVVGRRDGRALIEVVRVPGGEGPEVDRSLALKVRELIGMRDGAAYALGVRKVEPKSDPRRVALRVELGAQLSDEGSAGLATDLLFGLGPSLITPSYVIAVPLEVTYGFTRTATRGDDRVRWTELGAAGGIELLARVSPRFNVGGSIGGKLAFTDADGVAASGRTGTSTERLPALLLGAQAELLLSDAFGLRAAIGLEQRARRQRFFIEGRAIGETGRTIPYARMSLVWRAW